MDILVYKQLFCFVYFCFKFVAENLAESDFISERQV